MDRNRGFFGYLFEDLAVFDDAFQKGTDLLELLCAKEPGLCAGRAISVVPE
jgi:hypothetical protein